MQVETLVETSLYVSDPFRSEQFYRQVLGLDPIARDPRIVAMSVNSRHVLLLMFYCSSEKADPENRLKPRVARSRLTTPTGRCT